MPRKLEKCVNSVKSQGKSEDSAYAICSSSTGIKKKKGGGWTKEDSNKKVNEQKGDEKMKFDARYNEVLQQFNEKAPSAGLSEKKKSEIAKKAKKGEDIGKKGKNFKKVAKKAAKEYGSKEAGERVAAAAMYKNAKR